MDKPIARVLGIYITLMASCPLVALIYGALIEFGEAKELLDVGGYIILICGSLLLIGVYLLSLSRRK